VLPKEKVLIASVKTAVTDFSLVSALDADKAEVERTIGANFFVLDLWLEWERYVSAADAAETPQRNTRGNFGNGGDGDGLSGIHNSVVFHLFLLHIKFHISAF
jgi:hypothetical protein